jgi:DNA-directed RNA polymerase II subunit RPB2
MTDLTTNDMHEYIIEYIKRKNLIEHNIESFNILLSKNGLHTIITKLFKVVDRFVYSTGKHTYKGKPISEMSYVLTFTDVKYKQPTYVDDLDSNKEIQLTPNVAMEKSLTYSSKINIDCNIVLTYVRTDGVTETETKQINNLFIGEYPIMVKCNQCNILNYTKYDLFNNLGEDPNDAGGYFIISGNPWSIDALESTLFNSFRIYNNQYNSELTRGEFISKNGDGYETSKEIILRLNVNNLITIQLVGNLEIHDDYQIPFNIIFKLFGVVQDAEMLKYFIYYKENERIYRYITSAIINSASVDDKALRFNKLNTIYEHRLLIIEFGKIVFKNKKLSDDVIIKNVNALINKSILIHIVDDDPEIQKKKKLIYLGLMIRKLILTNKKIYPTTDRDSYSNKRVHCAGVLYGKSIRTIFRHTIVSSIKQGLSSILTQENDKSHISINNLINNKISGCHKKLCENVEKSIKTGNKEIVFDKSKKNPLTLSNHISSQLITEKNALTKLSALRVVHTPNTSSSNQTSRAIDMRSVHPTYVGYICPSASADTGEKVGLSKQLAITANVTISSDSDIIKNKIKNMLLSIVDIIKTNDHDKFNEMTPVYVNGDLIGCVNDAIYFTKELKKMRLNMDIDKHTTIYHNFLLNEVKIWVDYGRLVRPLIKVYNNIEEVDKKKNADIFKQYIKLTKEIINKLKNNEIGIKYIEDNGIIEYISTEEQENCYIAYNIDVFNENSTNICKQYTHVEIEEVMFGCTALTAPFLNHTMPQRGTYQTNQAKQSAGWCYLNFHNRMDKKRYFKTYVEMPLLKTMMNNFMYPNGVNLMVAMMCLGKNQEDSAIINKNLIDNGYMSGYFYTYVLVKITKISIEFIRPITDEYINKTSSNDSLLDSRGIIKLGSYVTKNTVLVSKLVFNQKENKYIDKSEIYMSNEPAIVDRIVVNYHNPHIKQIDSVKVKLKSYRRVIEGDKISTRSGNKNIISHIMNPADLPYTKDGGEVPDIIVNPQGIPTRMCIGQLLESLFSALALCKGEIIDGTSFSKFNIDSVTEELEKQGEDKYGLTKMINGTNGREIEADIFYTPLYIQHIMKFSIDEMYVIDNDRGPVDEITRQPREGRQNQGGLRLGEMEKDALASHGTTLCIKNKFIDSSDKSQQYYCKTCGVSAIYNIDDIRICKNCNYSSDIVKVNSTYVTEVLLNYLKISGIKVNMHF